MRLKKAYDLIGIGYPSIDHIIEVAPRPEIGKTSTIINDNSENTYFGGCAVNITCLMSSFGYECGLAMTVGNDFEASGFKSFLQQNGIALQFTKENPALKTSFTELIMSPEGEHITLFYPGPMSQKYWEPYDFTLLNPKYGLLTIGELNGNTQFLEECLAKKIPLIFSMKGDYRSLGFDYLKKVFETAELLFMNQAEYRQLDEYLPNKVLASLKNGATKAVIVTDGKCGSTIYTAEKNYAIPAAQTIVKDPAGGGDAYVAGFLAMYLGGKDWQECGMAGAVLASFIIEEFGCLTNIPTIEAFKHRLAERKLSWRKKHSI